MARLTLNMYYFYALKQVSLIYFSGKFNILIEFIQKRPGLSKKETHLMTEIIYAASKKIIGLLEKMLGTPWET